MKITRVAWILLLVLFGFIGLAYAEPSGPGSVTIIGSSGHAATGGAQVDAIAGNVTELNINGTSVTQTWQGYFGNITGQIVLGDANNNTFYDWISTSPTGEVYATRTASVPTWSSIKCANITNVAAEDTALGVNQATDQDSVNRTFLNTTSFNTFFVGPVNINSTQNCYATHLYNNTGATSNYQEVLLHDTTNMIYTAIVNQDVLGFDSNTHDFQMIVGENGHLGDTSTTTYYFYVELG